jgi:diaminopimelate epimerase
VKLNFTEMRGAGNDFVVLDGYTQRVNLTTKQVRALANRHFGSGNHLLLVERPTLEGIDFRCRIVNRDGDEVEDFSQGARYFDWFVRDRGFTDQRSVRVRVRVQVQNGMVTVKMQDNGGVMIDMGTPVFDPERVPFVTMGLQGCCEGADTLWPIDVNGTARWLSVVSMGNPYAVQVVNDVETFPVLVDGPVIERHTRFPQRVNAGFMQIVSRNEIRLRVYERGAGETLASGTSAGAAMAAGIRRGLLDSPALVHTHGGDLTITWDSAQHGAPLRIAYPATKVFEIGHVDVTPEKLLTSMRAEMEAAAIEAVLNGTTWLTAQAVDQQQNPNARNPPAVTSRWKTEGKVFSIERAGHTLYPRYIFDEAGNPISEVAQILKVFNGYQPFRIASWFESTNSMLRGKRPREVLATNPAAVIVAARDYVVGPVHG